MYFRRSATPCSGLTEAPNDDDGNKDTLLYYNLKKIKQKFSFPRVLSSNFILSRFYCAGMVGPVEGSGNC